MNVAFLKPLRESSLGGFVVFMIAPVVIACGQPTPRADAGVVDASVVPRPVLRELRIVLRVPLDDGGVVEEPFDPAEHPLIDPTSTLSLSGNLGLTNYRVRVFDEADRAMISDDEQRSGKDPKAPLDYRIRFPTPLKPGHRYFVVLDAESGASPIDGEGRAVPEQRLEVRVRGEKERPVAKKKPARRHPHR